MNQSERFYELLENMKLVHDAKRHDYANTDDVFANFRTCEQAGIPAWKGCCVRIGDKFSRIMGFAKKEKLKVELMGRGYAWLDTGTQESLLEAGLFIQTIERRTGLKISCPEEVAFRQSWISEQQMTMNAEKMKNNNYGKYLLKLLNDN